MRDTFLRCTCWHCKRQFWYASKWKIYCKLKKIIWQLKISSLVKFHCLKLSLSETFDASNVISRAIKRNNRCSWYTLGFIMHILMKRTGSEAHCVRLRCSSERVFAAFRSMSEVITRESDEVVSSRRGTCPKCLMSQEGRKKWLAACVLGCAPVRRFSFCALRKFLSRRRTSSSILTRANAFYDIN